MAETKDEAKPATIHFSTCVPCSLCGQIQQDRSLVYNQPCTNNKTSPRQGWIDAAAMVLEAAPTYAAARPACSNKTADHIVVLAGLHADRHTLATRPTHAAMPMGGSSSGLALALSLSRRTWGMAF